MDAQGNRAVLLDALGTLVRLEPPAPLLVAALAARGVDVGAADAARAMRAEIAFYRAEHHRAGDRPGLEALRDDCAAVVERELATGLALPGVRAALLEAIRFTAFPEVPAALARLRDAGVRLAVVSNWDVSLHDVLRDTGLAPWFGGVVVTSAELGIAKPDPAPFHAALSALGVASPDAWHCGDDLEADVGGARAAGVRGVLVARDGAPVPAGVDAVADLVGLAERVTLYP